jgi:hypothetical protein
MTLEDMEALERETRTLKQKVELANLYHHWMEEFNNLKMEYVFMKVKLLITSRGIKGAKPNNGHCTRNRLRRLSNKHLKLTRRMRNFTNNTWRLTKR